MNIYRREMRGNLRALVFWVLGVLLFIAASMAKFSALVKDPSATSIFTELPMGLQALFGVGELDFTQAIGFYAMIYPYLVLMAAIHASMLGAVILSKEERDKTTEFLYVKPAARAQVLTAKLLAALSMVCLLNLIDWAVSVALVHYYGTPADATIAILMVGMFLVQVVFLALGFAAAAVLSRPKAATGVTTAIMLGMYILSVAISINENIGWAKVFTPFAYFDSREIVAKGVGLNLPYAALCVGLIALLLGAAYTRFPRRDLTV